MALPCLLLVDENAQNTRVWHYTFEKNEHIDVICGSLFNLPKELRIDAYVIGTSSVGDILAPPSLGNRIDKGGKMLRQTYKECIPTVDIKSMLDRHCLPVGFGVILKQLGGPPYAIAVPIRFYGSNEDHSRIPDRTRNAFCGYFAVLRLVQHYNHGKPSYAQIRRIACPNLCPQLSPQQSAIQIQEAWRISLKKHSLQGCLLYNQYYVPKYLAGAQERCDANLEFEPFFEKYLPRLKLTLTTTKSKQLSRSKKSFSKHQIHEEKRAEAALGLWRRLAFQDDDRED